MSKIKNKTIFFVLSLALFFGFFQIVQNVMAQGLIKLIGETTTITADCYDANRNLETCSVKLYEIIKIWGSDTPWLIGSKTCDVSGRYGTCVGQYTCSKVGIYDVSGTAVDTKKLSSTDYLSSAFSCARSSGEEVTSTNVDWDHCLRQGISVPTFIWTTSDPRPQSGYQIKIWRDWIEIINNSGTNKSCNTMCGEIDATCLSIGMDAEATNGIYYIRWERDDIGCYTDALSGGTCATVMRSGEGGYCDKGRRSTKCRCEGGPGVILDEIIYDSFSSYTPSDSWIIDNLDWGKTYDWQVRVVNDVGAWSNWSDVSSFTLPNHPYPYPNFDWAPKEFSIEEDVQLCSTEAISACESSELSVCYNASLNEIPCLGKIFNWTIPSNIEFLDGSNQSSENPKIELLSFEEENKISLKITDDVGFCEIEKNIESIIPPPVPENLDCQTISSDQIDLSWDSVSGIEGYEIYRCQGLECDPTILVATQTEIFWSNTDLSDNTIYRYKVRSYNLEGSSSDSDIASCTTDSLNSPPSSINLNVSQGDYCEIRYAHAIFSWEFTDPDAGDYQSAYRIQIDDNSDFSSLKYDSGKINSSNENHSTPVGALDYNANYYWRLMVWDDKGAESDWITGPTMFATPEHAYPSINFNWIPKNPSVNEVVQFVDLSEVYGGTTKSSWEWIFPVDYSCVYPEENCDIYQNPSVSFLEDLKDGDICLTVTDSDGYSCPGCHKIEVSLPLPEWKEISPFIWLRKNLASLSDFFGRYFKF